MYRKSNNRTKIHRLVLGLILSAVLAACAPAPAEQETRPADTQTIVASETVVVSPTAEASATPESTPTITATSTPENTATPEFTATPEAMTQAEIRAEILAAGVNLDDLANSEDEWVRNHLAIESIQSFIDNNFGRENTGVITTVVIGLEAVENLDELEQALLTDGGWKLTAFAKLAYKDINGDWQIIKVPLSAYHAENDLFWIKNVGSRSAPNIVEGEKMMNLLDENGNFIVPLDHGWISWSTNLGYHYGVGSFIIFSTAWLEDPTYVHSDCLLGDPPRYSEEQLIEFRKTGDPSIFGYQDSDGYWILWPLVTFDADVSELTNYDHE